jgi:23S rRNA (adenine1618-N6)-methyltransferase
MIEENASGREHCIWFNTLISKSSSLPHIYRLIKNIGAVDNRTFEMSQGQKKSRFVAWTFMSKEQRRVCGKR